MGFLDQVAARTDDVVECLRESRWDDARRRFDSTLAAALNREQLKAAWTEIELTAGPLVRHDPARADTKEAVAIGTSRLELDKAELTLCAAFNSDLTIAGLTIRPAEVSD